MNVESAKHELKLLLKPLQERVERDIRNRFITSYSQDQVCGRLKEACEYALLNGGKRFRPILVHLVADALKSQNDVTDAALAIEYLHTASLIADDLPCMDNDDERRNVPSLHKKYDETTALLASYALIADGYGLLASAADKIQGPKDGVLSLALANAAHNAGLQGAAGGQYLDLFPPDQSLETIKEILKRKTVSLFEVSFVLGWLYGGGNPENLPKVKKCALHFGMAFQIADDLGDMAQDQLNECEINSASALGAEQARVLLDQELQEYKKALTELGIASKGLLILADAII